MSDPRTSHNTPRKNAAMSDNGNGRLPGVLADLALTQREIDEIEGQMAVGLERLRALRTRQIREALADGRRTTDIARALKRTWHRARQIINAATDGEE